MEELFKKILSECGFELSNDQASYYSNQGKSYIFWLCIDETKLKSYVDKDALNKEAAYKLILDGYKAIVNSGKNVSIEKNSSLIILVQCQNTTALAGLQQQILFLEEDEYFFKKYVILYTPDSIANLTATPILPDIRTKISNLVSFDDFAQHGFIDRLSEYLLIMQLFIKLPFLTLSFEETNFTTLEQKINSELNDYLPVFNNFLTNSSELNEIDFLNSEHGSRIDTFLKSIE